MLTAFNILSIVLLLLIVVQDFYYRAVYWWLCPLLAILLIVKELLLTNDSDFLLIGWLVNISVIFVQLLIVWLYALLRKKSTNRKLLASFGLGDVLCLYALCFLCQPYLFIVLCCVSYIVALIAVVISPKKFKTIPLAGWVAAGGLLLVAFELISQESLWTLPFTLPNN